MTETENDRHGGDGHCPECGEEQVEKHVWSDGAITRDCDGCGWWDWQPPGPTTNRQRGRA